MPDQTHADLFELFKEISIIEQLSRVLLEARLPEGLIAPHFTVLNHMIRLGDGRAPIDLARSFQVPKTTMTHTLKGLERHKLVEMRPNPDDGRSKLVYLTDAGRSLRSEVITALGPDFEHFAAGFDMRKVSAILPVLTELRIFLDEDRNGSPPRSDRRSG
ncbi:MarR family winged helix-turn-helix transcriptional regulator [Roseobacter weihaiensis]|uniref:MarR family winged helix-turn-helix transcriptional regulator n=1 Tax=Roseobacter weihaiensis TaxID=2763262 RepID=UPI001D0BB716|nr:MarR family transcriptional regulator [Roseobacter sp. H9]